MENDQTKSFHDNCFLIKRSKALSQPHDCLAVGQRCRTFSIVVKLDFIMKNVTIVIWAKCETTVIIVK